jgi:DHA1 family multidrug resistance protein-like MFS transporter
VCMPAYCAYYHYNVEPRVKVQGFGPPEDRLIPGLVATFFKPAGLFLFGTSLLPRALLSLRREQSLTNNF